MNTSSTRQTIDILCKALERFISSAESQKLKSKFRVSLIEARAALRHARTDGK